MYYINSECGTNLSNGYYDCTYYSVHDKASVTVNGSCASNSAIEGNFYSYNNSSGTCYLSDAYSLDVSLNNYNTLMGFSGMLFGWLFFGIVLYIFSFMGRK